jgi:hypothetical protein
MMLEDSSKESTSSKHISEGFISAAKGIPNTAYMVASLDKIDVSSATPPQAVKDGYDNFKSVLNEYIKELGTVKITPSTPRPVEIERERPSASVSSYLPASFDISRTYETDRDKFDYTLTKYKQIFTTTASPKSKVLYDKLVRDHDFTENGALLVCFDIAKAVSQIKFCVLWSTNNDEKSFEELCKKMSPDDRETPYAFSSSNLSSMVVFYGNRPIDRDTLVHEVGHSQESLRNNYVHYYQSLTGGGENYYKKHYTRTGSRKEIGDKRVKQWGDTGGMPQYQVAQLADPDMETAQKPDDITDDQWKRRQQTKAGVLGGEFALEVMGDLNAPLSELQARAKSFIQIAPQDFMITKPAPSLDYNVERLLKLANYVFYRVTGQSFKSIDLLDGTESYSMQASNKTRYPLPLGWLRSSTDENTNVFRQISAANKRLMGSDPSYSNLADVRPALWKELDVTGEDMHVYAVLALMGPRRADDLLQLQSVAAADIETGDEKVTAESRVRITANDLRKIIREELLRSNKRR